jgi:TonB-linked SusC/RagA family outer membrane protein
MKIRGRKNFWVLLLAIAFICIQTIDANAESKKVTGQVTDEKGEPFPGATVFIKKTGAGVITDVDGKFNIKAEKGDTIMVSFIGMETKHVKYAGGFIDVVLAAMAHQVDEVIVTGYQTISRRKASSSVVTVKAKDINESGAGSVDQMLEGKITGLSVIGSSSTPGAAPKIRVRGSSSISGNREPIWVVDGVVLEDPVPISATDLNSLDKVNLIGNAISSLNPEDIDRIDVLKDASATAIYGTRAANGVIVVTTKKGKFGPAQVKYTSSYSVSQRPSYDDLYLMNSKDRIEVSQEIEERGLKHYVTPARLGYEGALYDLYDKNISYEEFAQRVKSMQEQNTDWFDEFFRNSFSQKHTLTISGANKNTNYYFSGGYNKSDATIKGSGLQQANALMKMQFKLTDDLNIHFQLRGSDMNKEYLHSTIDVYDYAVKTSRVISPEEYYNTKSGKYGVITRNMHNDINNSGREIGTSTINFTGGVNYQIFDWFRFSGLANYSLSSTKTNDWMGPETFWSALQRGANLKDWDQSNSELIEKTELPIGGEYKEKNTNNKSYMFRGSFSMNKAFGEHEFSSVVGSEIRSNHYEGLNTVQRGYLPSRGKKFAKIDLNMYPEYRSWVKSHPNTLTDRLSNFISFYVTGTYTYDWRYSLNFNYRTDGSNKFGQDPDNRFLPVWSASARWNLHNEHFMQNQNMLSQFAIRASYGVQGNVHPDQTPNLIITQGNIDMLANEYTSTISKLPNSKLRWEKTTSQNLGIDYGFFRNRITGTFELYNKLGTDQIVSKATSLASGVSSVSINKGDIENKGWEFIINTKLIESKDWKVSFSINASKNYNRVTNTGEPTDYTYKDYLAGRAIIEGNSVDDFYSYKFAGLDNQGLPTFHDIQENGETKDEMFKKVFKFSGSRTPDFTGGVSLGIKYKKLTLSANMSYSVGKDLRLTSLYSSSGQRLAKPEQNMSAEFNNRWRKPGDEKYTNIPSLSDLELDLYPIGHTRDVKITENLWDMYNHADIRVVSGDYLRLRSLTLQYDFDNSISEYLKVIKGGYVKLNGRNLWLLADSRLNGQDPDHIAGFGGAPLTPSYTFTLSLTF